MRKVISCHVLYDVNLGWWCQRPQPEKCNLRLKMSEIAEIPSSFLQNLQLSYAIFTILVLLSYCLLAS